MTAATVSQNALLIPVLPRGVRLHFDKVRNTHVLLGPERALMLDEIGYAVLEQVDGQRSLDQIAKYLAEVYQAPVEAILADISDFIDGFVEKRLIDLNGRDRHD